MGPRRKALGLPIPVVPVAANLASLREGLRTLRQRQRWDAGAVRPVALGGPFGICHKLVAASTLGRLELTREQVTILGPERKAHPGARLVARRNGSARPRRARHPFRDPL